MSELLTPPENIMADTHDYRQRLSEFRHRSQLPKILFETPDHLMIKASDPQDFSRRVETIKPWTEYGIVAFTEVDTRFLVAAKLVVAFAQVEEKPVNWVEIMESKSPDGTADYMGLEYAEFYFPNFGRAERFLQRVNIEHERRSDSSHRWLNVPLGNGQEVHITDKRLRETIDDELESGAARLI